MAGPSANRNAGILPGVDTGKGMAIFGAGVQLQSETQIASTPRGGFEAVLSAPAASV